MKWNDDWRNELELTNKGLMNRLAECRSRKEDMPIMAKAMHKYNPNMSKEDCLVRTLEWICDWNNQYNLDPTQDELNEWLLMM